MICDSFEYENETYQENDIIKVRYFDSCERAIKIDEGVIETIEKDGIVVKTTTFLYFKIPFIKILELQKQK